MSDNFDFEIEASELLKKAVLKFAEWASENWTMTEAEATCLTKPTNAPKVYARGYNDGIASLRDAAELWIEGDLT